MNHELTVTGRKLTFSESTQRRNPHLFVGAVQGAKREPNPAQALDSGPRLQKSGRPCVVVSIISCRHRILDSDNFIAGAKSLRDAIADALTLDDADPRVIWQYEQLKTQGPEGTIVLIQTT